MQPPQTKSHLSNGVVLGLSQEDGWPPGSRDPPSGTASISRERCEAPVHHGNVSCPNSCLFGPSGRMQDNMASTPCPIGATSGWFFGPPRRTQDDVGGALHSFEYSAWKVTGASSMA